MYLWHISFIDVYIYTYIYTNLPEIDVFTTNFAPNSVLLYDFKHPFVQHQPSPRRWSNNSFTMEVYPYLDIWPPQTPCGAHVSHEKNQGNLWGHRLAVHKTWSWMIKWLGMGSTNIFWHIQVLELKYTGCKFIGQCRNRRFFFLLGNNGSQWKINPQDLRDLQVFATAWTSFIHQPKTTKETHLVLYHSSCGEGKPPFNKLFFLNFVPSKKNDHGNLVNLLLELIYKLIHFHIRSIHGIWPTDKRLQGRVKELDSMLHKLL